MYAPHSPTFDANPLTHDELSIWLRPVPAEAAAQKIYLGIGERKWLSAISYDLEDSGSLQNLYVVSVTYPHKKIGWKKGKN
jgi:hypothetical protein